MNKLKRFLARFIIWHLTRGIGEDVKFIERNIQSAPPCCGKPMDYIGENIGYLSNTQLYQCLECKRVGLQHLGIKEEKRVEALPSYTLSTGIIEC